MVAASIVMVYVLFGSLKGNLLGVKKLEVEKLVQ